MKPSEASGPTDPFEDVLKDQVRITLMLVDEGVAKFFKEALGDSTRVTVKEIPFLTKGKRFLVTYAEEAGNLVEISGVVNLNVRKTLRRITLSPESVGNTPPVAREEIEQGIPLNRKRGGGRRVRVSTSTAVVVASLACIAGFCAAWATLAFGT